MHFCLGFFKNHFSKLERKSKGFSYLVNKQRTPEKKPASMWDKEALEALVDSKLASQVVVLFVYSHLTLKHKHNQLQTTKQTFK